MEHLYNRCRILGWGGMLFSRTWPKSHCGLSGLVVCCVVQAFGNSTVNFNSKAYRFFSFTYSCFSNKSVQILAGKNIIAKPSRNRGKWYIVSCDWLLFKTLFSTNNELSVNRYFLSKKIRRLHVLYILFDPSRRCFHSNMFLKSKRFQESGKKFKDKLVSIVWSVVLHSLAACTYVSFTWTLYGRLFMKVCWILELQTNTKDWKWIIWASNKVIFKLTPSWSYKMLTIS